MQQERLVLKATVQFSLRGVHFGNRLRVEQHGAVVILNQFERTNVVVVTCDGLCQLDFLLFAQMRKGVSHVADDFFHRPKVAARVHNLDAVLCKEFAVVCRVCTKAGIHHTEGTTGLSLLFTGFNERGGGRSHERDRIAYEVALRGELVHNERDLLHRRSRTILDGVQLVEQTDGVFAHDVGSPLGVHRHNLLLRKITIHEVRLLLKVDHALHSGLGLHTTNQAELDTGLGRGSDGGSATDDARQLGHTGTGLQGLVCRETH